MHGRLAGWELQHCQKQTFSLAFEPLVTFLVMTKAQRQHTLIARNELANEQALERQRSQEIQIKEKIKP